VFVDTAEMHWKRGSAKNAHPKGEKSAKLPCADKMLQIICAFHFGAA